jgi:hypothetical protein
MENAVFGRFADFVDRVKGGSARHKIDPPAFGVFVLAADELIRRCAEMRRARARRGFCRASLESGRRGRALDPSGYLGSGLSRAMERSQLKLAIGRAIFCFVLSVAQGRSGEIFSCSFPK